MKYTTKNIKIYSENNEFQHAEVLKRNRTKRLQNNKFFVEGVKLINLAIENQWTIDTFLYSDKNKLSDWAKNLLNKSIARKHVEMPRRLLEKLSDKEESSELMALIEMKKDSLDRIEMDKNSFVVVIDRAQSPGNLGTIIRSCDGFGAKGIVLTGHSVDLYDPKTIRASLGTLFSLPVIKLGSHNDLIDWASKKRTEVGKIDIIGTTVKTSTSIDDVKFKTPLMLLIGSETFGLSENYKGICDKLVKIPIRGSASSLNVACATSIFLNEINRQTEREKNRLSDK